MRSDETKTVAVYDLGGGTFDISVLRISDGIFEVLSTNGNTYLGGDDFDRAIMDHWISKNGLDSSALTSNKSLVQELRLKAEEAKKYLSDHDHYSGSISGSEFSLTRDQFEKLIEPFVAKTIQSCENAMQDADLTIQ